MSNLYDDFDDEESTAFVHLKAPTKKRSMCGISKVPYSISIFDINCPKCIDVAVTMRVNECSLLDKAKELKKPINTFIDPIEKFKIRKVMESFDSSGK